MLDTSHPPIGPCGPLGPWPCGDNSRHASTVLLSLGLECGENAGGGTGWDTGETVGLSFKFWDIYNGSTSRSILYEAEFGFGVGRLGIKVAHAPALQEFGNMLTRRTRNRIQIRNGKRICACWRVDLVVCVGVRVFVYLCNSVLECTNAWVTDPLAQPRSSDIIQS